MLEKIVPDMTDYTDKKYMEQTKKINDIVDEFKSNRITIVNLNNRITDLHKQVNYLQKAVRNQ